ncbi:NADPH-dependent 7-cyano-7-deazaguanine reductase QueF [Pseudomaricurvus sp. HS19]|uniref:NADPH-dependent 7-cyano-7-deazaguanine reductase QueF n=1 Tax=Pseudomaricurvus sp. HS19 TaxID=2692626 RepID=UPI0013721948|nr:NADPH-dependent 7-cyano-7-deazaguanine reductase QueF [Pseudomaricurvus sp. HS19]MYM61794.1 NADPH-dependent 7-cyano-7-deazaguanine reductase QueF [Pseudomaricurvus sp. HS19]
MSSSDQDAKSLLLGQHTEYPSQYAPQLLFPIAREESRRVLGIDAAALPFRGVDVWTGYEVSWLNPKGKPQVAVVEFAFPADSPYMVESKSFKLYLNSLNQARLADTDELLATLMADLGAAAGAAVQARLLGIADAAVAECPGLCLDDEDVTIEAYEPQPQLLSLVAGEALVTETLYSELLKTNCPVTGQPDWATISVSYSGPRIDRAALLSYIISFRNHQDFHEHCVERMFTDILQRCRPQSLTVFARYTRRGGLDINPCRTTEAEWPQMPRLLRQ